MLKRLASCIGEYKKYAILTPLIMVGEVVIECLIPFIIAQIVDSLKKGVALSEIMKSGVLLFFMACLSLTFGATAGYTSAKAASGFSKNKHRQLVMLFFCLDTLLLLLAPLVALAFEAKYCFDALGDGLAERFDVARMGVERWCGGQNNCASLGEGGHIAEVNQRIWRLAHHENKAAALLQHNIGCAFDKGLRYARGHASDGANTRWHNHHSIPSCRATSWCREHIFVVVLFDFW